MSEVGDKQYFVRPLGVRCGAQLEALSSGKRQGQYGRLGSSVYGQKQQPEFSICGCSSASQTGKFHIFTTILTR